MNSTDNSTQFIKCYVFEIIFCFDIEQKHEKEWPYNFNLLYAL